MVLHRAYSLRCFAYEAAQYRYPILIDREISMRYSLAIFGFMAMILLAAGPAATAATPKIGVVDIQAVIANSNAGQSAQKKLKSLVSQKRKEIGARRKKLVAIKKAVDSNAKKKGAKARKRRKKLLNEYRKALNEYQQDLSMNQQDLDAQKQSLLSPIQKRLGKVLNEYAKDHDYNIILNKDVGGALYATSTYDITTEVTEAMDKAEKSNKKKK
jgi:outer membrane protein